MVNMNEQKIEEILNGLSKSNFRSKFHLKSTDKQYIEKKGLSEIEKHTRDFIHKRLAPSLILNDGKQTPMKGHPTFIAQHATATCCRNCLYKWHKIPKNMQLNEAQIKYIVTIIMTWIKREMQHNNNE